MHMPPFRIVLPHVEHGKVKAAKALSYPGKVPAIASIPAEEDFFAVSLKGESAPQRMVAGECAS